jgi:hypothetical protein
MILWENIKKGKVDDLEDGDNLELLFYWRMFVVFAKLQSTLTAESTLLKKDDFGRGSDINSYVRSSFK